MKQPDFIWMCQTSKGFKSVTQKKRSIDAIGKNPFECELTHNADTEVITIISANDTVITYSSDKKYLTDKEFRVLINDMRKVFFNPDEVGLELSEIK